LGSAKNIQQLLIERGILDSDHQLILPKEIAPQ